MIRFAAALALLAFDPPPPDPQEEAEIVVTGRGINRQPHPDAIALFQRHCFDPLRRTGRVAAPDSDDQIWQPLDEETRQQVGANDDATILVGMVDHVRGHRMILRSERLAMPGGLTETRCVLTLLGGGGHDALQGGLTRLFGGGGTDRHVGAVDGSPRLPGWRQRVWTATPARGASAWRDFGAEARRPGGTWVVVADPGLFYRERDYVLGDLKTRVDGPATSVIGLALTTREPARGR